MPLQSPNVLPLNPLNVPAKILQSSEKKQMRKLITTSIKDERFIDSLRENLEITYGVSLQNKMNKNIKGVTARPSFKNFLKNK